MDDLTKRRQVIHRVHAGYSCGQTGIHVRWVDSIGAGIQLGDLADLAFENSLIIRTNDE